MLGQAQVQVGLGGVGVKGLGACPVAVGLGQQGHLEGAGPRLARSSEPPPDPARLSPEQNAPVKPLGAGDPSHPSSSTVQPWILQDQGSQQKILAIRDEGGRHEVLGARSGLEPRGVPRGLTYTAGKVQSGGCLSKAASLTRLGEKEG